MILDRGCSLDVADVEGDTVLHLAARRENNELLAALLRKGANPDIKNGVGIPFLNIIKITSFLQVIYLAVSLSL
jgi:ankyrin repeat protein